MSNEKAAGNAATEQPAWFDASWDPEVPLVPAQDLHPAAQAVMEPGEQLLWTGTPVGMRGLFERLVEPAPVGRTWPFAVLSILVGLLSLVIANRTFGWGISGIEIAVGGMMGGLLLGGLAEGTMGGRLLGRLVAHALTTVASSVTTSVAEADCIYAVTDRRAIRVRRGADQSYSDIDPLSVEVSTRADGRGELSFFGKRRSSAPRRPQGGGVWFVGVSHIRQVERLLFATLIRRLLEAKPSLKLADESAARVIGRCLRSRDMSQHVSAVAMLLRMEPDDLERLVATSDMGVPSIWALGIVGIWRSIGISGAAMIGRGLYGNSEERHAASQAIPRLGRDAVGSLIEAWAEQDARGRTRMLTVLTRVEPGLLADAVGTRLLSGSRECVVGIADAEPVRQVGDRVRAGWVRLGSEVVRPLMALAEGTHGRASCWAARALGLLIADGMSDRIRASLSPDGDPEDAPQAALLAYLGDPSGTETLARCLGRSDIEARLMALDALGRLGAPAAPALEAIRQAEEKAQDREERALCRQAIGRIQDALGQAPAELEASAAPAGTGTEPEAAPAPAGTGTELASAPPPMERSGR